jgi:hypothetical protein
MEKKKTSKFLHRPHRKEKKSLRKNQSLNTKKAQISRAAEYKKKTEKKAHPFPSNPR